MAAWAKDDWISRVANSTSEHLTRLLHAQEPTRRVGILAVLQDLREHLQEEFTMKLQFWDSLPHKLLGILVDEVSLSKAIASACQQEWDGLDNKQLCHRVAHRFFSDSKVAAELSEYIATDKPLQEFRLLY